MKEKKELFKELDVVNIKDGYKQIGLEAIVKWTGGKTKELKYIIPNLPKYFDNYYEPFVGGGAVYTAIQFNKAFINDKSKELIDVYKIIKSTEREKFFKILRGITYSWGLLGKVVDENKSFFIELYKDYFEDKINTIELTNILFEFILQHLKKFSTIFLCVYEFDKEIFIEEIKVNLIRKIKRIKKIDLKKKKFIDNEVFDNIETAFKSAFYMCFRYLYNSNNKYKLNDTISIAIFLFIRNFAYSGMFRYNSQGKFNVPYGGIGYNKKNLEKKIDYFSSIALQNCLANTIIENEDFEFFLKKYRPTKKDFIFLDPPYDTKFSTYAQNKFTRDDHKRLADYLLNKTKAKWMMIIKKTDFILDLYLDNGLDIKIFDKTYLINFKNRNNKKTKHLMIKNY